MSNAIDIRPLTEPDELEALVDLEIAVWGVMPRDAVPMSLMRPISLHGGLALGAFDGDRLVGMALALPLRHAARWLLWSHMTGVHPDYQGQGIGFALKQAQRDWALENGYSEIRWTFDPLQRGNAHFNLHILGASAEIYHVAYYGFMHDNINRNGFSDRVEVSWKLKSPRVKSLARRKQPPTKKNTLQQAERVLVVGSDGLPLRNELVDPQLKYRLVTLPRRHMLENEQRLVWQNEIRQVLRGAFSQGYVAVDYVDDDETGWYVLEAAPTWYLYVLRCADGTFYTGVTPDLTARLARHQSGKGAAYTATRRPVEMIGAWAFTGRSDVLKAEIAFKRLTRATKLGHILRRSAFRGADFVEPSI